LCQVSIPFGRWPLKSIVLAALVFLQAAVPFTPEPRVPQWRLGFDLGNAIVLETPELNPKGDPKLAVDEAERALPDPVLSFGLALLPFSKITTQTQQLVNPKQWTIVDLQGKTTNHTFQAIAVFMGRQMATTEGGYHLVSLPLVPSSPFLGVRRQPSVESLIFAFAGRLKRKLVVQTRLSETRWENLLPVEDPAGLPLGYETAKQLLDNGGAPDQRRFLYGTSIHAVIQNRATKLWLLNYSHPDTTVGTHPWGIFAERQGSLEPLYVSKATRSENEYVAYFTAALDLNQDGNDEVVVEASYRNGTAFKVISATAGKYSEIFTSYYRGQ
jgi:hypothetical protein